MCYWVRRSFNKYIRELLLMCGTMVLEREMTMDISRAKKIIIIAAVSQNGVIGLNGGMPWNLSADLKRFKDFTIGRSIIMGGRTMRGILGSKGKPLPNRQNIVLTRYPNLSDWRKHNLTVARSVEESLELAKSDDIYICGGSQIYSIFLDVADEMKMTEVLADIPGDTFFPKWNKDYWRIKYQKLIPAGPKDEYETKFIIYRRKW
ncbi:MAG: dihydrofolate reductase [Candidatus Colwellbacteria bacterium]|jgi:dihydrofolate reductase|nr:dihydrofolate reductase [Candidatus Colwellbacteria bacterium]MDD4819095.1 dihydrofolate reductase [Candidatus Colwellbacteria bacterium]